MIWERFMEQKTSHHSDFDKRTALKKGLQRKPNNYEDSLIQSGKTESQLVVSLYYFCNSLFTLFQTINFGIDDTSSSDKTFSTASICCFARGWLRFIAMYYKTNFIQQYLVNTFTIFYLMSTTCTKSDDSAISSNVALKAATCRK